MLVIASFFLVGGVAQLNLSLRRLIDNPGGWSLENGADAIAPVPCHRHAMRCAC